MSNQRPFKIYCKDCGEHVHVSNVGRIPVRCARCSRLWAYQMKKAEKKMKGAS